MINVENIKVYNIARAIYSARNALNSWDRSDSDLNNDIIGENDLKLAQRLYKAGTEHRKYLRQIFVSMDITAPMYWFSEFDTYKVGTVANSTSKMHTISNYPITVDNFSMDSVTEMSGEYPNQTVAESLANICENYRKEYLRTKDKRVWRALIQILPESWNQKRTVTMNYENIVTIIKQRSGHKLDEWNEFVEILKGLPYVREIIGEKDE